MIIKINVCAKCKRSTTFKLFIRFDRANSWNIPLCKLCWKVAKYTPLRSSDGQVISSNWAVNVFHIGEDDGSNLS